MSDFNYMKEIPKLKAASVIGLKILGTLVLCLYLYSFIVAPDIFFLKERNPKQTQMMKYRIAQAKKMGRDYSPRFDYRPLSQLPPHLVRAVLIAEDGSFYKHGGFDLRALYESVWSNLKRRKFAFGGSTISMQLAKNLYLSPKKSIFRKAIESVITFRLERNLSKARILELYLNYIEWGPGLYGANQASYYYFNKPVSEITSEEAVFLATMIPAPLSYSRLREKPYLRDRFIHVAYYMDLLHETPIDLNYRFPNLSESQKQAEIENQWPELHPKEEPQWDEQDNLWNVPAVTLNIDTYPESLPSLNFKSPLE